MHMKHNLNIAIVGIGALFPGARDKSGLWSNIIAGRDLIGDVPLSHWDIDNHYDLDPQAPDKTYGKRGGFLDSMPWDPEAYGIAPESLVAMDSGQLLSLTVARELLRDLSYRPSERVDPGKISVILGLTSASELLLELGTSLQVSVWRQALQENGIIGESADAICEKWREAFVPLREESYGGMLGHGVAGQVARLIGALGNQCVVDGACASSLSALHLAAMELQTGRADFVVSGGVDTMNDLPMFMCFSKTPALSASGDARPFSAASDGTILGEGIGLFALRRLEDAERDGDKIYAVIQGIGTSSDGKGKSVYAPSAVGQIGAMQGAYEMAGYGPQTVGLMEAHGTGTSVGDVVEFEALTSVFSGSCHRTGWCALGSIKSQIGHTKGAAGAAALIKVVLALHHKVLPPTIKVDEPNPKLGLAHSPFYLNTQATPWFTPSENAPRRAALSAFGFGGVNVHVTVEEYTKQSGPRVYPSEWVLLVLEADGLDKLIGHCTQVQVELSGESSLPCIAMRLQSAYTGKLHYRVAVTAFGINDAKAKLAAAIDALKTSAEGTPVRIGGAVFFDVGQVPVNVQFRRVEEGRAYPRMGSDLAIVFEEAMSVWERLDAVAGNILEALYPRPFIDEVQELPDVLSSAAIDALSSAQLAVLSKFGISPHEEKAHDLVRDGEAFRCLTFVLGPGHDSWHDSRLAVSGGDITVLLDDPDHGGLAGLWYALGAVAVAGIRPDFEAFWSSFETPQPIDDTGPNVVHLNGANYGRPQRLKTSVLQSLEYLEANWRASTAFSTSSTTACRIENSSASSVSTSLLDEWLSRFSSAQFHYQALSAQLIDRYMHAMDAGIAPIVSPARAAPVNSALAVSKSCPEASIDLDGFNRRDSKPDILPVDVLPLGRYQVEAVPAPAIGMAMPYLHRGIIAVTDDGNGIAELVVERLRLEGIDAVKTDRISSDVSGVIFLGGLRNFPDIDSAIAVNVEAFRTAQLVANYFNENGGLFVAVQDTGGDFGLSGHTDEYRAWSAGLAGLVKTAGCEWPKAAVKVIDLERQCRSKAEIAAALVGELLFGGPEREVGLLAAGERLTLSVVPTDVDYRLPLAIQQGDVVVVTGGARGITAPALVELARTTCCRIAILGRSELVEEEPQIRELTTEAELKAFYFRQANVSGLQTTPVEVSRKASKILAGREVRRNLERIRECGADVLYLPANVENESEVEAAFRRVRSMWGPVSAIVHAAGYIADKRLTDKTEEQFTAVLRTKVTGLRHLLATTAQDPLKIICLFSSVTARFGNAGQSDYAAANEVLNKVAAREARLRCGVVVKSLCWGAWDGGMVSPSLKDHFAARGIQLISVAAGARAFVDELRGREAGVEIVLIGEEGSFGATGFDADRTSHGQVQITSDLVGLLRDHSINGTPVLPAVMALEWTVRFARACHPDLPVIHCRELQVLKGLKFDDETLQSTGGRFTLRSQERRIHDVVKLSVELTGPSGQIYYRSLVEMSRSVGTSEPLVNTEMYISKERSKAVYGKGHLFHGPRFQTIRELFGIGPSTAAALIAEPPGLSGWPEQEVTYSPALLDAGLQLMLLWGVRHTGSKSLPMRIGSFRPIHPFPAGESIFALVDCSLHGVSKIVGRVRFALRSGKVLAEMDGIEMYIIDYQ